MKLKEGKLEYGISYPYGLHRIVALNLVNLEPWEIIDEEWLQQLLPLLKNDYPNRKLLPFASRKDCNLLACLEAGKGEEVQMIHLGADSGWEQRSAPIKDFWTWFKMAIDDMIEFE
ncbi:MAG: hypothetical protein J6D37_06965 [Clostridia bacterium]|nr:hypothetical protein [Clostridia bacterium]